MNTSQTRDTGARSFLRWAGSKSSVVSELAKYWSDSYRRYVEPFAGSACLFFALQPGTAILADLNPRLIETFRVVRESPDDLAKELHLLPLGREAYYEVRSTWDRASTPLGRAAAFIYLNRFCFNGLFRTNAKGTFNVPYAGEKTGRLPDLAQLVRASEALRNAELVCSDFEAVLHSTGAGDFVYIDPPYATASARVFRQYEPNAFSTEDLPRLAAALDDMDERGVAFVLSYADCPEAQQAFSSWSMSRLVVRRNIAGFAQHRRKACELLVTNRAVSES